MKRVVIIILGAIFLMVACNQNKSEAVESEEPAQESTSELKVKAKKEISEGQKLFILCSACHNLKKGEPHKVGPSLYGIFGKKAGIQEGFNYTEELKNSGIVWDKETLRAWLENPADFIPGTSMAFVGIDDKERQDILLEYLVAETKEE